MLRQPGFICRVAGVPADDPCVNTPPATAYWGLFYSDGRSGSWTYSSLGARGLKVPEGGYVGVAWQSGGRSVPGLAPAPHVGKTPKTQPPSKPPTGPKPSGRPEPKKQPSPAPTASADPTPDAGTPTPDVGSPSPEASASPDGTEAPGPRNGDRRKQGRSRGATEEVDPDTGEVTVHMPGAEETDDADEGAADAGDDLAPTAADGGQGSVPVLVGVVLVLALAGAAVVGYRRRRIGA